MFFVHVFMYSLLNISGYRTLNKYYYYDIQDSIGQVDNIDREDMTNMMCYLRVGIKSQASQFLLWNKQSNYIAFCRILSEVFRK